jgi:hypothetical protein
MNMSDKDDAQGMINGIQHVGSVGIRGAFALQRMLKAAGTPSAEAEHIAEEVGVQNYQEMIKEHLGGKSGAAINERLAAYPPIEQPATTPEPTPA